MGNGEAAFPFEIESALSHYGVGVGERITDTLQFAEVKAEIDAGRPILVRVKTKPRGGRHMVIVFGYEECEDPQRQKVGVFYTDLCTDNKKFADEFWIPMDELDQSSKWRYNWALFLTD